MPKAAKNFSTPRWLSGSTKKSPLDVPKPPRSPVQHQSADRHHHRHRIAGTKPKRLKEKPLKTAQEPEYLLSLTRITRAALAGCRTRMAAIQGAGQDEDSSITYQTSVAASGMYSAVVNESGARVLHTIFLISGGRSSRRKGHSGIATR